MIYYDSSLAPVIESIYLEEPIDNRIGSCNIIVNPENLTYIFGKTIIINDPDYIWNDALKLRDQGCKVISRIYTEIEGISYQPYIMRINMSLMWNGETIDLGDKSLHMREILDLLSQDDDQKFKYEIDKKRLYFPKIKTKSGIYDIHGSLGALGWALHQVGIDTSKDCKFKNLDLLKLGKVFN
jgi:hypothetical protein